MLIKISAKMLFKVEIFLNLILESLPKLIYDK